jgi:hypothetical protein
MALTIAIEGKGVIANADAETDDTGGTGTGDWAEDGAGSMGLNTDVYLYGSSCMGSTYARKTGFTYFDIGAGNELDFDVSGTEEGQFIYIWLNILAAGTLETLANKGLAIRIGSSLTDYKDYLIAGSNDANGWAGGWKLFVLDPRLAYSDFGGSCDIGAIRYIGLWIDTAISVRADTIFIDQIAVGKGLRITGTSDEGWADAVAWCTDYANRAWGMLQEREGIIFAYGGIWIGSDSQTSITDFKDHDKIIQFGSSEYRLGSAWVLTYPWEANKIVIEDASSYQTYFQDGFIVGTDGGRGGCTYLGTPAMKCSMSLHPGNHTSSASRLYGTALKGMLGPITWGNDTGHRFYGGSVVGCGIFDPVGAIEIRNSVFVGARDMFIGYNPDGTGSALLWNANIDIESCQFIANTDDYVNPHAIEHPVAGTFDYKGLLFSGNDFDIHFTIGYFLTYLDLLLTGTDPYYGVWSDGTWIFVASGDSGLRVFSVDGTGQLTHEDVDQALAAPYYGVWGDGTFIYAACYGDGIRSYTVDGGGNLTHKDNIDNVGTYQYVWGDGTFVYASAWTNGLHVYTVDASGNFTWKDTDFQTGAEYQGICGDGTYIFVACGASGLRCYSVNGSGVLTHEDVEDDGGYYRGIFYQDGYIFVACDTEGLRTYTCTAGVLALVDTHAAMQNPDYNDVWGDGTFVYVAAGANGILRYAYDVSGNLTYKGQIEEQGAGLHMQIGGDGTFLFSACNTVGLRSYELDENTGNLVINNIADSAGVMSDASSYEKEGSGTVTISTQFTHTLTGLAPNSEVTYTTKPTPYETGTNGATTAGGRTLTDSTKSWDTDEHKGKMIIIALGPNIGRYYVARNTATILTLSKTTPSTETGEAYFFIDNFIEVDHTENVPGSGINTYQYDYESDVFCDILVFHVDYEDIVLEEIHMDNENATIPLTQIPDVNYYNPS